MACCAIGELSQYKGLYILGNVLKRISHGDGASANFLAVR